MAFRGQEVCLLGDLVDEVEDRSDPLCCLAELHDMLVRPRRDLHRACHEAASLVRLSGNLLDGSGQLLRCSRDRLGVFGSALGDMRSGRWRSYRRY